jgi:hypothetical protein
VAFVLPFIAHGGNTPPLLTGKEYSGYLHANAVFGRLQHVIDKKILDLFRIEQTGLASTIRLGFKSFHRGETMKAGSRGGR